MTARAADALFLLLALMLPLSALIARRRPRGQMLRLALIWAVIFVGGALVAGLLPFRANSQILHNTYYQIER